MRGWSVFKRCLTVPVAIMLISDALLVANYKQFSGYGVLLLVVLVLVIAVASAVIGLTTCLSYKLTHAVEIAIPVIACIILPIANGMGVLALISNLLPHETFCFHHGSMVFIASNLH